MEGEPCFYPPCWSRGESRAVSSLLEQEREPCCSLPVRDWGRSLMHPSCWSKKESPFVSFLLYKEVS